MPEQETPAEINRPTAISLIKLGALCDVFAGICREMEPPISQEEALAATREIEAALLPYRETDDRAVLLRVLLGLVEDAALSLGVSESMSVSDRALPATFEQFGSERGTQVAANLLAADMILTDLSAELASFIDTPMRTKVEEAVAARLDRKASFGEEPVLAHVRSIDLYLRHAKQCLDFGGLEQNIALVIEAAFIVTRNCRKIIGWRLKEAQVPTVRQEVAAKLKAAISGADADRLAYVLARIGLLLGLVRETMVHLEKMSAQAKFRR